MYRHRQPPSLRRQITHRWIAWLHDINNLAIRIDRVAGHVRSQIAGHPLIACLDGWQAINAGHPRAAVHHFDRILRSHPSNRAALAGLAAAWVSLRRVQDAIDVYEHLLSVAPGDVDARFNYGVLLTRQGRMGDATVAFRTVLRQQPGHAQALFNLANLAQRDGRLAEAAEAWEAYLRQVPDSQEGWFNLGVVHLDFHHPRQAIDCFSYVVLIEPDDPNGYVNLALAYQRTYDWDAALETLDDANQRFPCQPDILHVLGELHRRLAAIHPAEAQQHLAAATQLDDQE